MKEPSKNALIEDFLIYDETIRNLSEHTIIAYRIDLTEFFRYLKAYNQGKKNQLDHNIADIDAESLGAVSLPAFYSYLNYTKKTMNNSDTTQCRKISSIKSFYRYLTTKRKVVSNNPADELELPKTKKREICYLEYDECVDLLRNIKGRHQIRDKAIITLFLNCGMRLNELTGIKLTDIKGDKLQIIGKGNKERTLMLNEACVKTVHAYLKVRDSASPFLFVSGQNKRMNDRTVQLMVKRHLKTANLDDVKISVHKLRHTSATLLFQNGVDAMTVKDILGHQSVSTTQIYTHTNQEMLRHAMSINPLNQYDI